MRLLLLGDVVATEYSAPLWRSKDINGLFGDTLSLFEGNDLAFVNLECAITDHTDGIPKFGPCLSSPKEMAEVLKEVGVTLVGLSNNHIFDFGPKGVADTLSALENNGLDYTGFGNNYEDSRKNYVFEKGGESVCLITVCEHEYSYALEDRMGSRPWDEFDTVEDVRAAKAVCDRVIVLYHGGKELCRYPSPRLTRLCRALVRAGADVVIGQHSHCIGSYEKYEGGHILYGQGNFHFVKPHDFDGWGSGMAVHYDTESGDISFTPYVNNDRGVELAKGDEREALMTAFYDRQRQMANGEWRDGWHKFCLDRQEFYHKVIREAGLPDSSELQNARFGHYLDCEAHTDVWRELYPTYNQTNFRK